MKPPPFEYVAPETVDEALALLSEHGDDAKVLAGGQSLVPLMNLRFVRPQIVVDINRIDELDTLEVIAGELRFGATIRHRMLERTPLTAERWPLIPAALWHVAHPAIRNRGTTLGSVAHADAASEMPTVLTALGARFLVRSVRGERWIAADDFFVTHLTTVLEPDELLCACAVPAPEVGTRSGFAEYARRTGDYAIGGAATTVQVDDDGVCRGATIALLAGAARPGRSQDAEAVLIGSRLTADVVREAAEVAAAGAEPVAADDAEREHRRRVLAAMARRSVQAASTATPTEGVAV